MLALRVRTAEADHVIPLDGQVTVGRSPECDIVLSDDNVSRRHAGFTSRPTGTTFMDLGSANGSLLNGVQVEPRSPVEVHPGDIVSLGGCTIELLSSDSPATPGVAAAPRPLVPGQVGPSAPGGTLVVQARPRLEVTFAGHTTVFELASDEVTAGRADGNDIVIPADVVSRQHLVLRRTGATYTAFDTGSANGIRVGGTRVASHALRDGDVLDIAGEVILRFALSAAEHGPAAAGMRASAPAPGQSITLGRDPACDLPLAHPAVSLLHARISGLPGGGVAIEDLGSTNGTFVNGEQLERGRPRPLSATDVVFAGPVRLFVSSSSVRGEDPSRGIRLTALRLRKQVSPAANLLQDISLVVEPQEFVAVVGVSGSGKSTLVGALSGLRPATGGDVLLNGVSLYAHFQAFRTLLGYVPQDDILHPELPVGRALAYAAELRLPDDSTPAERASRVDSAITTLGLEERRDVPVGRLSGGQRKRVSIGAELLTQPGLFFLDEATSGLDPGTESQLMRLLRRLADDGNTILLITHATKNVMMCDRVLFLARGGHLAYFGPPDRALTYFGVDDFDGIYELLESHESPADWSARFRDSAEYREFVARPLAGVAPAASTAAGVAGPPGEPAPPAAGRTSGAFRQFKVLSQRYLDIIRRDRVNLGLMFALAPALAMIDLVAWERSVLDPTRGIGSRAMTMLFLSALIPFLVGALSFVREIVKESAIYARERAVALLIWPYLGSKIAIATALALYHGAALLAIKLIAVDFSGAEAGGLVMIYVTLVLAVISGVMWGLLISTLTRREEQAMMLVIGVVVLQMVFSGGLVSLDDLGVAGVVLGGVTSSAWAFKAITTAAGLSLDGCSGDYATCDIPGIPALQTPAERSLAFKGVDDQFSSVFGADVFVCWGAMLAIIAALGILIYVLQRRKDTL